MHLAMRFMAVGRSRKVPLVEGVLPWESHAILHAQAIMGSSICHPFILTVMPIQGLIILYNTLHMPVTLKELDGDCSDVQDTIPLVHSRACTCR